MLGTVANVYIYLWAVEICVFAIDFTSIRSLCDLFERLFGNRGCLDQGVIGRCCSVFCPCARVVLVGRRRLLFLLYMYKRSEKDFVFVGPF